MKKQILLSALIAPGLFFFITSCLKETNVSYVEQGTYYDDKAAFDKRVSSVEGQAAQLSSTIDTLTKEQEALESYIETLQEQVDALEDVSNQLDERITNLSNETKEALDAQKQELLAELNAYKESIDLEISNLKADINKLQETDERLGERISSIESSLGHYAEMDWVTATFATLAQKDSISMVTAEIEVRVQQTEDDIVELYEQCRVNAENIAKLDSCSSELITKGIEKAKDTIIKACEDIINKAIASGQAIRKWVCDTLNVYYTKGEINAEINVLNDRIDTLKGRVTAAEDNINLLTSRLDSVNTANKDAIESNKQAIEANKQAIEANKAEIAENKEAIKRNADSIDVLASKILELDAAYKEADESLKNQISLLAEECERQNSLIWKEFDSIWVEINKFAPAGTAALKDSVAMLRKEYKSADEFLKQVIDSLAQDGNEALKDSVSTLRNEYLAADSTMRKEFEDKLVQISVNFSDSIKVLSASLAGFSTRMQTLESGMTYVVGQISNIQSSVDALKADIDSLNIRVQNLEKLVSRIQKIDVIPDYSDGSVEILTLNNNEIDFLVSPDSLAVKLKEGYSSGKVSFKLQAVSTLTRAATLETVAFSSVSATADGVLSFIVDGNQADKKFYKNSYNACLKISDDVNCCTSGFFHLSRPVYPEAPNEFCVTIVAGGDTTTWAPVNCGFEGDYKYGKLFQWGRKFGCGYVDTLDKEHPERFLLNDTGHLLQVVADGPVSAADERSYQFYKNPYHSPYDWLSPQNDKRWNAGTDSSPIKTEYDPCPNGWRVPTRKEYEALLGGLSKPGDFVIGGPFQDQKGIYLDGTSNSDRSGGVFFPASGYRWCSQEERRLYYRGEQGLYYSSAVKGTNTVRLEFRKNDNTVFIHDWCFRVEGVSVRCVRENK